MHNCQYYYHNLTKSHQLTKIWNIILTKTQYVDRIWPYLTSRPSILLCETSALSSLTTYLLRRIFAPNASHEPCAGISSKCRKAFRNAVDISLKERSYRGGRLIAVK